MEYYVTDFLQNLQMVFLPEACDYIAISKEENRNLAEDLNGRLITEYKNLAKSHDIWISIGGMHELVPAQDGAKVKHKFKLPLKSNLLISVRLKCIIVM